MSFHGEKGSMVIAGNTLRVYDLDDKLLREVQGKGDDTLHFANFIDSIRNGTPLRAGIADAEKSTVLCHLGNVAWRGGQTVEFDPNHWSVKGDRRIRSLTRRAYRPGWEPKV